MSDRPTFAQILAPSNDEEKALLAVFELIAQLPQCLLLENYTPGTASAVAPVAVSNLLTGQNLVLFRPTVMVFKRGPLRLALSTTPLSDGAHATLPAAFATPINIEQAKKVLSVWHAQALAAGLSP